MKQVINYKGWHISQYETGWRTKWQQQHYAPHPKFRASKNAKVFFAQSLEELKNKIDLET